MCGIYASISERGHHSPDPTLIAALESRGPDSSKTLQIQTQSPSQQNLYFTFLSTVLALRGGHVYAQPITSQSGSVLCWNGEAWSFQDQLIPKANNDGQYIHDHLVTAAAVEDAEHSRDAVLNIFRAIQGPSAFVFFDKHHELLYFGRDRLGRRSLLFKHDDQAGVGIEFSSVSVPPHAGWIEVEADGIYVLDCRRILPPNATLYCHGTFYDIFKHNWLDSDEVSNVTNIIGSLNPAIPQGPHILEQCSPSILKLEKQLVDSLRPRVIDIPDGNQDLHPSDARLAVLFSGGLDCTVLARMVHDLLPIKQSIDLINVAFENPRVVAAAKKGQQANKAQDSSIDDCYEACPDRMTGWNAFRELKSSCPSRLWRFVRVNVPYAETLNHRSTITSLMHPHNTEMDLSIGSALYFASRGEGLATMNDVDIVEYTTTARVLLSGLGADELFGGYGRHLVAYERRGFQGLLEELELDVNRLGQRNLGRDDRILSHWGRETRFPFLDENLVNWALSSPVWEKCGFGNQIDESKGQVGPDKQVLRLLAQRLNLPSVAREKKRAIQFGARTAKMETGKTRGTTLIS